MPIHGEFHMLVHNAELAEKECGLPRRNIFVCDSGDVIEIQGGKAKKHGRVHVGGIMYDDSGQEVSEVVLKDRIHMSQEGIFVVMLTLQRGTNRLLTSPDIISRGFIYLRDSEELMGLIRQYLKQKVMRAGNGRRIDMEVFKKEVKDEITHLLYDKTRRTPIVIPVINEIGGSSARKVRGEAPVARKEAPGRTEKDKAATKPAGKPLPRKFPRRAVPDTEANDTNARHAAPTRAY